MPETTQVRLIAANARIPQNLKSYRTINVSQSGLDPNSPKQNQMKTLMLVPHYQKMHYWQEKID